MKRRRLSIHQVIPTGPRPMFQIVEPDLTPHRYHGVLTDAIYGDRPEFEHISPKACLTPPARVACALAGELNEARGLIHLQLFHYGTPVWTGIFVSNSRQVFCIRSSNPDFCAPVDLSAIPARFLKSRMNDCGL